MTRDERNRAISELRGWTLQPTGHWHKPIAGSVAFECASPQELDWTSPANCWKLLEEMLSYDPDTMIAIREEFGYFNRKETDSTVPCSVIQGPDLAEAICEAWLKLKGTK